MIRAREPFGVVTDTLINAATDPRMPFLAEALSRESAERNLREVLRHDGNLGRVELLRHRPGRRCLIAYDFQSPHAGVLGKARAKGTDLRTYRLMSELRRRGFDDDAEDDVSVPAPLGIVEQWRMTLQARVEGRAVTDLCGPGASPAELSALGERVAAATHKLHSAAVPPERSHSLEDELRLLGFALADVAKQAPVWRSRLKHLLAGCGALAAALDNRVVRGVHRDLYPDQVLVSGSRLYLLDLDLYAAGDPALDIGNFDAHLIELALRRHDDPAALDPMREALTRSYTSLAPEVSRAAIATYSTLSLARHIAISRRIAGREHLTGALIELCESRLAGIRPKAMRRSQGREVRAPEPHDRVGG